MSNAMAVRVDRTVRLECRWGALELPLFYFAETTERWFAAVAPVIAVELRRIRTTWAVHGCAGPATPNAAAVLRMIDALLGLTSPRSEVVGRVLGIELQPLEPNAMWSRFAASLASGPIAMVTLSSHGDTGATTVRLDARGRVNREELDLDRFGPRPVPESNPVAPEGVLTYSYPLHGKTLRDPGHRRDPYVRVRERPLARPDLAVVRARDRVRRPATRW